MSNKTYQITVRGIDARTKEQLAKKAATQQTSLNALAIESLRQTAGTDGENALYQRAVEVLESEPYMTAKEFKKFNEAIAWMDRTSKEKQKRDEAREFGI